MLFSVLYLLLSPLLLMGISGDWAWIEGWVFSVFYSALFAGTLVYLYFKDPALLAERFRKPGTGGEASWDKYLVYGVSILSSAWFIAMPLDAKHFQWSPGLPLWIKLFGVCLLALSSVLVFRSFSDNTFLSPLVRIQTERQHQVVSTGVYGFVRHPLYLGASCLFLGAPLFLGSLLGVGLGLAVTALLMARIIGEEELLVTQLSGYGAYRKRVKYRLIPFVW